jgi:UDP-2-acetamido-3-amino-2,3-dideoxy-glucuronate N-acetyltransferase
VAVAVELENAEPLTQECLHFLDCVARRGRPLSDGHEGLRVLKVLGDCQRSLEKGAAGEPRPAAPAAPPEAARTEFFAHESAYVDQPCTIGKGTRIWHFSHIMKGATIGENCSIGQNVVVGAAAVIGNGVKIQNNVSIYDAVTIEDAVFCGPSMVFTNVNNPRSEIVRTTEYRPTLIRHGANSTIVCGHTVGRYAFVAAGAVVAGDVPDFALMIGVPARQRGWMCRCAAAKLEFHAGLTATCPVCGESYCLRDGKVLECGE